MYFQGLPHKVKDAIINGAKGKIVALPEGDDPRILSAQKILEKEFHVHVRLGRLPEAKKHEAATAETITHIASVRGKAVSASALALASDVFFDAGAALTRGEVHAVVGGVSVPTAHVIRAALATVGLAEGVNLITSAFLFSLAHPTSGGQSTVLYADAAVMPDPTPEQLADIALLAGRAYEKWTAAQAQIAFLSFSTHQSSIHPSAQKMQKAFELFKNKNSGLSCDGELQFDAAVVPDIASRKAPTGSLGGRANVFIFPDLNAGNIAYKITQRLAGAQAWGPVLLGSAKPFSDLSRGASDADVVHSALLTLALAQ